MSPGKPSFCLDTFKMILPQPYVLIEGLEMLKALDCYRMNELGLDTKIPKNGPKIYPEILQKCL